MSGNINDWIGRSGNESDWNGRSGNISDWDENGGNGDILNYEDEDLNLNFTQDYCQVQKNIIKGSESVISNDASCKDCFA